jgi:superfamily I DNA/RNA helicase
MIPYDRLLEDQRDHIEDRKGHTIFHGVPGSGKTTMLLHRAARAALAGDKCLVLCFNIPLAQFMSAQLRAFPNITVLRFGQWSRRQGVYAQIGAFDSIADRHEEQGQRLLEVLQSGGGEAGTYDAVFIDEGQDFPRSWFKCARMAMKDPDDGNLWVMLDINQTLWRKSGPRWSQVGIKARGRSYYLRECFRNTLQIALAADTFAGQHVDVPDEDGDVVGLGFDPKALPRRGPWPVVKVASDADAFDTAKRLAEGSQRQFVFDGVLHPLAQDIAILYRRASNKSGKIRQIARLQACYRDDARVTVSTIHRFKGLEADLVILLRADELSSEDYDNGEAEERALLYTAMTRARTSLVILSARETELTREIDANLSRAKSTFAGDEEFVSVLEPA